MLNRLIADQWDVGIFGFSIIYKLISGLEWSDTNIFPRVTICNFHVREMSIKIYETETASKSIQCMLVANMFIEKFYIFLWFWLFGLLIANIGGLCLWIWRFQNRTVDQFLKGLVKSGINFVDFVKAEKERLKQETQKAHGNDAADGEEMDEIIKDFLHHRTTTVCCF